MSDDLELSDRAPENNEVPEDMTDIYCYCGTLLEHQARQVDGRWELWLGCPKINDKHSKKIQHYARRVTDQPTCIVSKVLNPDSLEDVIDDNFTKEQVQSIIQNSLFQRFYLPCPKCQQDTIQIRYQRQMQQMKFYSICVRCEKAFDLANIKQGV